MKITDMKCPNCGANIDLHEDGAFKCEYCGQVFYVESNKVPIVRHTIIDDHNYGEDLIEKNDKIRREEENPSHFQEAMQGLAMIFVMLIVPIIITVFITSENSKETASVGILSHQPDSEFDEIVELVRLYVESKIETKVYETFDTKSNTFEVKAGETDISYLSEMDYIANLIIHDASKIKDYSVLEDMPYISRLTIRNAKKLKNADFLKSMNRLEYLDIEGSRLEDLSMLENNISLIYLTLENNKKVSDYSFLESLTSLKQLRLKTAPNAKIPDLSKNKFLKTININGETK